MMSLFTLADLAVTVADLFVGQFDYFLDVKLGVRIAWQGVQCLIISAEIYAVRSSKN